MEVPFYRVPVIVVGEAYYKRRGFTEDPESREQYFALLEKYHDQKYEYNREKELFAYMHALQQYRRKIHYGEFSRYTGRQEFGRIRGHSFDFEASISDGFPWEKKGFREIVDYLMD